MSEQRIPLEKVRALYEKPESMWSVDAWHRHTRARLEQVLATAALTERHPRYVLHVGSAGEDYGIQGEGTFHVDVSDAGLRGVHGAIVGDVHTLPIANSAVDLCVCVGSVINHCDAAVAISELGRVMKDGSWLALEFETSDSWEYLGTSTYRASAAYASTFYGENESMHLWVYSMKYVSGLLRANGLILKKTLGIHILSTMAYRLFGGTDFAARLGLADRALNFVPGLRGGAGNVLILCQKAT